MQPSATYKIVPGEGGHLIIRDVGRNLSLFPDRAFPSEQVALDALSELAKERGWRLSVMRTPDGRIDQIESYSPVVRLELEATTEFNELLDHLAVEIKGTRGQALLKGLALLQVALDAKREGKRLVVVDDRDNSEEEVTEV